MGICCMAQEPQTGALYQPRGVGWGEEGDSGMYGESNMENYITICITDSQWEFAV